MKRLFIPVLALSLLGFVGTANAIEDVVNTVHNLATSGPGAIKTAATDDVCIFCHSPHTEVTGVEAPLWNRTTDNTGYTMYASPTLNMDIALAPEGVSLACLSCHDGVIALDSLINGAGSGNFTPGGASQGWTFGGGVVAPGNEMPAGSTAFIGRDLSADHPISVTYDDTRDIAFDTIANVETAGLKFFGSTGDRVECATCHNPHEATNLTFLRIPNAASDMCTTCHSK